MGSDIRADLVSSSARIARWAVRHRGGMGADQGELGTTKCQVAMDTSSHHRTSPPITINVNMSQSSNINGSAPPEYHLHQSSPKTRSYQPPSQDIAFACSCHLVNLKQAENKRQILRNFNRQLSDFTVNLEIELARGKATHPSVTRGQRLLSVAKLCHSKIHNIAFWIRLRLPGYSYRRLRFLVGTCLGLICRLIPSRL